MSFVNAHTHLELSDKGAALPEPNADFFTWILGIIDHISRPPEAVRAACEQGVEQLLESGTTHVGDISWSGLSVEPLARSGLRGIVWLEVLGSGRDSALRRLDWVKREIDRLREVAANSPIHVGLTMHAPYSIHPDTWEPALRWVESENVPLCIHLAESAAEWELMVEGTGPFRQFEETLGLSPFPAAGCTPVAYLARMGVLDVEPLLVHMVHVTDGDIDLVAGSGATVVHCPRSNDRLRCGRAPIEKYVAAGVPLLLGTDSLASSPSLDVREEARFAGALHNGMVGPELLDAMVQDAALFESHYC